MNGLLLDTCAAIWIGLGAEIAAEARAELDAAWVSSTPVYVSPISALEIGMLVAKGRLAMTMPPDDWFSMLLKRNVTLAEMPPRVLMASSFLPGAPPNDPYDRVIASTARADGLKLMTRDAKLLAYAAAGHLSAIAC